MFASSPVSSRTPTLTHSPSSSLACNSHTSPILTPMPSLASMHSASFDPSYRNAVYIDSEEVGKRLADILSGQQSYRHTRSSLSSSRGWSPIDSPVLSSLELDVDLPQLQAIPINATPDDEHWSPPQILLDLHAHAFPSQVAPLTPPIAAAPSEPESAVPFPASHHPGTPPSLASSSLGSIVDLAVDKPLPKITKRQRLVSFISSRFTSGVPDDFVPPVSPTSPEHPPMPAYQRPLEPLNDPFAAAPVTVIVPEASDVDQFATPTPSSPTPLPATESNLSRQRQVRQRHVSFPSQKPLAKSPSMPCLVPQPSFNPSLDVLDIRPSIPVKQSRHRRVPSPFPQLSLSSSTSDLHSTIQIVQYSDPHPDSEDVLAPLPGNVPWTKRDVKQRSHSAVHSTFSDAYGAAQQARSRLSSAYQPSPLTFTIPTGVERPQTPKKRPLHKRMSLNPLNLHPFSSKPKTTPPRERANSSASRWHI